MTNVQNWLSALGISAASAELAAAAFVFIFLVFAIAALFRVSARQKQIKEEILRINEAVQASDAVHLQLMRDQIAGIREEIMHAATVQSNHFANFLQLSQNGSDSQEKRLERVGQNLSTGLEQVRQALAQELSSIRQENDKALASMRETNDKALAALRDTVDTGAVYHGDAVVSNSRHYEALTGARTALRRALEGLDEGLPGDLLSEEIREVIRHLGSITGRGAIAPDEVLEHIFSKFCVGK